MFILLSSYLSQLGLEAIANEEPNIASLISQGPIIQKFKSVPLLKEIWDKAERIARQRIDESGVVRIQLLYVDFLDCSIRIIDNDFDLSIVKNYTILSTNNNSDFVKAEVLVMLFS